MSAQPPLTAPHQQGVDFNASVVGYLSNEYSTRRAVNHLSSTYHNGSNSTDIDWWLHKQSLFPTCSHPISVYDHLCGHLSRTASSKSKIPFTVLKWFPDGRRIIGGTASGELTLWSGVATSAFEDTKRLPNSGGSITALEWLNDNSCLIVGDWSGGVHLTNSSLSPLATFADLLGHSIVDICSSPTSMKMAALGNDSHPVIWDVKYQTKERSLSALGFDQSCLQWHPTKGLLASGSKSSQMILWDPRTGDPVNVIMAHKSSVSKLKFSPCGKFIITIGHDTLCKVWDITTLKPIIQFRAEPDMRITSVDWYLLGDSTMVLTGDSNGTITYYDLSLPPSSSRLDNHVLFQLQRAHASPINDIDIHPANHIVASGGGDGKLKFWAKFPMDNTEGPLIDCSQKQ